MLARLQRNLVLAALVAIICWLAWWLPGSPVVAAVGAALLGSGHAVVLAVEFGLLAVVGRSDPAPRPSLRSLVRAWAIESAMAPRVFGWRQPFRAQAVADQILPTGAAQRGVVLVHGLVCNRGFWTPWLRRLRADGRPCLALSLEPVFGDIDKYTPAIEAAVRRLTEATGLAPTVVCHSMGGLAVRAWLGTVGNRGQAHRVVTIGTPHHGTWLARLSRQPSALQMRRDSPWLSALAAREPAAAHARYVCWYSNCDNIVFPVSTATLPGADNRWVPGVPHVALAFDRRVMDGTFSLFDAA